MAYTRLILELPSPAILFWGPEQTQIYNDGYATIMGPRHPRYFGSSYRECWPDTYPIVYPWMRRLLETGEITEVEKTLIPVTRHGFTEESYFTFTFSPLRGDSGRIEGIYQPVVEVTEAVLGERRAETLRALGRAGTVQDTVGEILKVLSANPHDLPFAALYLRDPSGDGLLRAGATFAGELPGPGAGLMEAAARRASAGTAVVVMEQGGEWAEGIPLGPWPEPVRALAAHPLPGTGGKGSLGVLVFGLSPRLRFDDEYRGFLESAAGQAAALLESAADAQESLRQAEGMANLRARREAERREYIRRLEVGEVHMAELLAREQAAHAEAEAHRSRLHTLFMEAPALIALFRGPDHVLDFHNPQHQRLQGGRAIVGKPLREILPTGDGRALAAIMDEVYRTGESFHGREFQVEADWGNGRVEKKYFNFVYQPIRDARGRIEGLAVFGLDVTTQALARLEAEAATEDLQRQHAQLQRAEAALRESQERLLLSLDAGRLGAWDCLLPDGMASLTDRARDILDVPSDAVVRLSEFIDHVHPDDRPKIDQALAKAVDPAGPGLYTVEYRTFGFRDGKERWVATRGQVYFDAAGKPARFMGTVLDIMDRKQSEREIHKFMTLIEESRDFVMILEFDGRIAFRNTAATRLASSPEGAGSPPDHILDLCLAEDRETARGILAQAAGGFWEGEFRFRGGGSRAYVPVWWNVFVLRDRHTGQPFALASVGRDLTQIKETEEHLRQTQKMEAVGKLAGGIAHDFNNLLTAINGYADLALAGVLDPELREYLGEIRKSGERAANLTRQLLAYSRKQVLAPRPISLNAIVLDMEQMLRRLIGEDIELRTALDPDLGVCRADPGQVEQIVLNLVFNARDAMPQGGTLAIETENVFLDESRGTAELEVLAGPYAMLSVRDSGTGMGPEVLGRIFEPFFTTKEVGKGTGLGLSSVYGILKQSGGSITVESRPGQGSTFRVYLPITEAADKPPGLPEAGEHAHPPAPERATILLVEDEEPVRRFIRTLLERKGYEVLAAADGSEALELADTRRQGIHLVLADVIMPRMGGQRMAERLRRSHPEAALIFMSGYSDQAVEGRVAETESPRFLHKPFTSSQLFAAIRETLAAVPDQGP